MEIQRTGSGGPPAPYNGQRHAPPPTGPGAGDDVAGLGLADVLRTLRRHLWIVTGVTLVTLAAVAWWVLNERTMYRAEAVVQVTDTRQEMAGLSGMPAQGRGGADPLVTQLQVLRSRSVVGAVADQQGLRLRPVSEGLELGDLGPVSVDPHAPAGTIRLRFLDGGVYAVASGDTTRAEYGQPLEAGGARLRVPARPSVSDGEVAIVPREEAIDATMEALDARLRPETSIIDVSYRSHDPERARAVVNALVERFAEHSVRTAQDESRRRRVFLEEQLAQVDSLLQEAQASLTGFRSQEGVYSSTQQGAAQQSGLLDLQMRREELAADRRMYQSLLRALTQASEGDRARQIRTMVSAPGIAGNPVVSQLYGQMIRYELARDSLVSGEWGSARTNPDVERLEGLLESTRRQLVDAVHSHIEATDARLAALDELQARTSSELRTLPALEAQESRLAQQVETVRRTADQLRQQHQEARIAEAVESGDVEIIDRASRARPVDARRPMKLGLGLALGLMLGASLALVMDSLNTTVRTREDVEHALGLATLGVVPRLEGVVDRTRRPLLGRLGNGGNGKPAGGTVGTELVALRDRRSSGAEAYRTLRTNILFSRLGDQLKAVVVTSAGEAEGKTTVAANLATTFAQQGMRVLLVDADLRKARVHSVFGLEREPGLTDWLLDEAGGEEAIRSTEVDGLYVLPSGTLPPNPSELLGSPAMQRLLTRMREGFELVLFDSPPLLAAGDAAVLGAHTDGVVMVVRAGQTDQGAAREGRRQLENVGARVLGAVLNDPSGTVQRYGGYYHYEYYGEKG